MLSNNNPTDKVKKIKSTMQQSIPFKQKQL